MIAANTQAQEPIQYPYYPLPDLSDEMFTAVCKRRADTAWNTLGRLRNREAFAGSTAKIRKDANERHTIHVGYHTLAKLMARDRKTVRRMFRALEDLGLVRVRVPQQTFTLDPKTGLIARRQQGRCQPVEITMIVTDAAMRPSNAIKERKALGENFPRDLEVGGKNSTSAGGNISTTSLLPLNLSIAQPPDGHADGVGRPQAAEGEEDTDGLEAVEDSFEEGDVPAIEAIAGTDTDDTPSSWTFAQKAPRSTQAAKDSPKRSRTPKGSNDAGNGRRDAGDGNRPAGEAAIKNRYYRSASQLSQTDAEYAAWRQERLAAAQTAASEAAAAVLAIRPTRAKMASSACRMAAAAGV